MQTNFTLAQLANPALKESESILRTCVHCGFCIATCPTYVLLGDELDSPRGRIYLIKDMLENARAASATVVRHIDRCLSCLACMTTCPSSVHYMHLVDHARVHIERTYKRPAPERWLRRLLGAVLPRPRWFAAALAAARLVRPLAPLLPGRLADLAGLIPGRGAGGRLAPGRVFAAVGPKRMRIALLTGCVQQALAPAINEATVRLLTRLGCEVVIARGSGCCGALPHHLGQEEAALGWVRRNVAAWTREIEGAGLDAVVINASGCGTMVKDYGYLLRGEADQAAPAARVTALARDVTELVAELPLADHVGPSDAANGLTVAYQSACSLQHGQGVTQLPKDLLARAGFKVLDIPEGHLCCGSAGTYNMLQPALARCLRDRKLAHIEALKPDAVAAGNIGCMVQLAGGTRIPMVHTVELLDWASGGPRPGALAPR